MMIFQSDEEEVQREQENTAQWIQKKQNLFLLSQEQKSNINKRLPRGFCLIRKQQYDKLDYMKKPALDNIIYEPIKIQRQIDLDHPIVQAIDQTWNTKKQQQARRNNRFILPSSMEGKSRQSEKIKNIIQRFRKLIKNTQVQAYLNKVGLMDPLNQIQLENKRGMLTIDLFRIRYTSVLETAKKTTFEIDVSNQIDEMIEEFVCYVEQARKAQFQNNIQTIQKSIDKITRYLSETADGKSQGNWYIRKKKKGERNDNYSEKQMLYFGQLVRKLPPAYLIGLWEIINERPFTQADRKTETEYFNLADVGSRKLRDIEVYVKSKLSQLYRSRERKKQKIEAKRRQKQQQMKLQLPYYEEQKQSKPKEFDNLSDMLLGDIIPNEKQENPLDLFIQDEDIDGIGLENQMDQKAKNQPDIPDQIVFQAFDNIEINKPIKLEGTANADGVTAKLEGQQNRIISQDSIDINNSSDSSLVTDEDESDF